MAIPIEIWEVQIFLALLCTAHSWFGNDQNNYTDIISGVLGFILWTTSGISLLAGVKSEDILYTGGWLAWIFIGISIIVALISIVKMIDVIRLRNSREWHVAMSFDTRL